MIIEVNTNLLKLQEKLNSSQLLFLSMVLGKNQKTYNQDVQRVLSLISEDDISYLIDQNLVTTIESGDSITYQPTEKTKSAIVPEKDYFDIFFDMYPVYVIRPDGSKAYLRVNINKCRTFFNSLTKGSIAYKEHIIKCLDFEVNQKMNTGKICYMKTMWTWLTQHQWEESEQAMRDSENQESKKYGTDIL